MYVQYCFALIPQTTPLVCTCSYKLILFVVVSHSKVTVLSPIPLPPPPPPPLLSLPLLPSSPFLPLLPSLLQSTLSEKVSAADIASLMPSSDGDEAGSLMPKLLELQTKINQLEGTTLHMYMYYHRSALPLM